MTSFESTDLSQAQFPQTWAALHSGLEEGVAPGFVVGLWQKKTPHQIMLGSLGKSRVLPSSLPMTVHTVFDLASLSKIIGTSALAAVLVQRGWVNWETPVSAVLPEFQFPKILLRHLLSHTAGYDAWQPFWERIRAGFPFSPLFKVPVSERQKLMRELIFDISPSFQVDEKAIYSDISFLMLGFVLEELTQMPLDQAVKNFVWNPMGLESLSYRRVTHSPEEKVNPKIAATENCPWRGAVLQGQVHDDNCWAMGGYGGHAGVFGTARDVLFFAKRCMEGFFSADVLSHLWSRAPLPIDCSRTLGWDTPSGATPSAGKYFSKNSVGHLGFTGTSLWIDLDAELAVTLLTNRVHPTRENHKIQAFRPKLHEAIRLDLGR